MITSLGVVFLLTAQTRPLPKGAKLQAGEVVRFCEEIFSRAGQSESIVVLTPTKAYVKTAESRMVIALTKNQQTELKAMLSKEPTGLKAAKRSSPMWPSAYDGADQWMTYRVGRQTQVWTNYAYEYPQNCPLMKFIESIRSRSTK